MGERLKNMPTSKLIDVVKNAKQYGYDETIISEAMNLLKERGISEEELRLQGNLSNHKYETTKDISKSYIKNSRIAFGIYILTLVLYVYRFSLETNSSSLFWFLVFTNIGLTILYIIFLILSLLNHSNFYKSLDKELGIGDELVYVVLGMPFYFIVYFYYKAQMKEELQRIN